MAQFLKNVHNYSELPHWMHGITFQNSCGKH